MSSKLQANFALEVQRPFSVLILNGSKNIETRAYPLPEELLGVPVLLLESAPSSSSTTISQVPDIVNADVAAKLGLHLIGSVVFTSCFEYTTAEEWERDRHAHAVQIGSSFDFVSRESSGRKWGWVVDTSRTVAETTPASDMPVLKRKLRSIFAVAAEI